MKCTEEKVFERLVMRSLAEILTHLVTMTGKSPRAGYAQRYFDQLWVNLEELG